MGCHQMPILEWLEKYELIGQTEGYTANEIIEYKLYLDFIAQWIEKVQPLCLAPKSAGEFEDE